MLLTQVIADVVARQIGNPQSGRLRELHIFADCDKLHLGSNDPLPGIPELGDWMSSRRLKRPTMKFGIPNFEFSVPQFFMPMREVAII